MRNARRRGIRPNRRWGAGDDRPGDERDRDPYRPPRRSSTKRTISPRRLFDVSGLEARLIAQAPGVHAAPRTPFVAAVERALDAFKVQTSTPATSIVASDPYDGGTHIPDHVIPDPGVPWPQAGPPFPRCAHTWAMSVVRSRAATNPQARDIWQDGMGRAANQALRARREAARDVFDLIVANEPSRPLDRGRSGRHGRGLPGWRSAARRSCWTATGVEARARGARRQHRPTPSGRVRAEIANWAGTARSPYETHVDHDYMGRSRHSHPLHRHGRRLGPDARLHGLGAAGFAASSTARSLNTVSFVFVAITSCCDEGHTRQRGLHQPR